MSISGVRSQASEQAAEIGTPAEYGVRKATMHLLLVDSVVLIVTASTLRATANLAMGWALRASVFFRTEGGCRTNAAPPFVLSPVQLAATLRERMLPQPDR